MGGDPSFEDQMGKGGGGGEKNIILVTEYTKLIESSQLHQKLVGKICSMVSWQITGIMSSVGRIIPLSHIDQLRIYFSTSQ